VSDHRGCGFGYILEHIRLQRRYLARPDAMGDAGTGLGIGVVCFGKVGDGWRSLGTTKLVDNHVVSDKLRTSKR
jgi:hypothetical protein